MLIWWQRQPVASRSHRLSPSLPPAAKGKQWPLKKFRSSARVHDAGGRRRSTQPVSFTRAARSAEPIEFVARPSAQTVTEGFTSRLRASRLLCQVQSASRQQQRKVHLSHTLAIPCVSTCDRELKDTLDILKYFNRANSIRNRIMVDQDMWDRTSAAHRVEFQKLMLELTEYKQGKVMVKDGTEQVNDMFYESSLLQTEDYLRKANEPLQEMIEQLIGKYTELVAEQASEAWFGCGDSDTAADVEHLIQRYQNEEEEIEKSTDADEDTVDNSGNESSDYEAEELEKYVSMRGAAQLLRCQASGVFEGKEEGAAQGCASVALWRTKPGERLVPAPTLQEAVKRFHAEI
ncbi:hypothetical protein HPB50_028438 [Hyalomma asiaticum]|nr:hypothetical protein HPB50_028438 [Hyalomma asiaticum]